MPVINVTTILVHTKDRHKPTTRCKTCDFEAQTEDQLKVHMYVPLIDPRFEPQLKEQ